MYLDAQYCFFSLLLFRSTICCSNFALLFFQLYSLYTKLYEEHGTLERYTSPLSPDRMRINIRAGNATPLKRDNCRKRIEQLNLYIQSLRQFVGDKG
jgi:hypothetical protein